MDPISGNRFSFISATLDIVGKPRYNVSNPKIARARDFLLAIEA